VTSEATAQELRTQLLHGWLGSLALHGLLLLTVLPLFRLSPLTVPMERFHWDVTLVQSAQTADKLVPTVDAVEQTVSSRAERAPMPARSVRTIRPAAPSADPIVPIQPQTVEPVTPTSQPSIASSAASSKEAATASISDNPAPNQPQASDPPLQQTDTPANSTTVDPSTTQTAAATSSDGTVGSREPAQPLLQQAAVSDREAAPTPRLDYGWLQQAIFRRLEELKRSSRPFLDQSQPLKVMVKAVVSREGILLDSSVAKSSGLDHIDQEAIALVQRAFPMQLDRTLDRQQIVMRIPITYSRE
jgi:TonB family protein